MVTPLFEDTFEVRDKDADKKKFDKVSRIDCTSENYEMRMILDVNTDIYPIEINEKYVIAIADSLVAEGAGGGGEMEYDQSNAPSLADKYEYVMYGKVFKYTEDKSSAGSKVSIYVSFGGLLMCLQGDPRNLAGASLLGGNSSSGAAGGLIKADSRIYLLMRGVRRNPRKF
eukprot:TRINITY_DN7081_c0_g1_i1.p1 TRINITY_DN7081_c0_g1~~TRINITY_DN7081_c0_g1_i1.p1  ORF type:complete len:178 (-),score=47.89 TRINITY_DN7081_c0_g1_i1:83-595(-)